MSKHGRDSLKKGILIKRDDTLRTNESNIKKKIKEDGPSIKNNRIPRTKSEIEGKIGTNDIKEPRLSVGRRDSRLSDEREQKTSDRENKSNDARGSEDKTVGKNDNKRRRDYWKKLYNVQKAINSLKVEKKETGTCSATDLDVGPEQPCCWCSVHLEIREYTPEESILSDEKVRASSNENSSEVFVTADEEFTADRHENTPVESITSGEADKPSRKENTQEESITTDEEYWSYRHESTPVESITTDEEDKPSRNENSSEDSITSEEEDRVIRYKNFPQGFITLGKIRHENTPVESITSDEEDKPRRNENSSEDSITSEEEDRVRRYKNFPQGFITLGKTRHENTPVESITSDEEYKRIRIKNFPKESTIPDEEYKVKRSENSQDDFTSSDEEDWVKSNKIFPKRFIKSDEEDTANRHESTPEESITSDEEDEPSRNKKSPEESITLYEEDWDKSDDNSTEEFIKSVEIVKAKRDENSPEESITSDEEDRTKRSENSIEEFIASDEEDKPKKNVNFSDEIIKSDEAGKAKSNESFLEGSITSDEEDRANRHENTPEVPDTSDRANIKEKYSREFITSDVEDSGKRKVMSPKEFITSDEEDRAKSIDKSTKEFITSDEEELARSSEYYPKESVTSDEEEMTRSSEYYYTEEFISSVDGDRAKSSEYSTAEFIPSDAQQKTKSDQNLPKKFVTPDKVERAKSAPPDLVKVIDEEEIYKNEESRKNIFGDTNIMHTWIDNVKESLPYICESCQNSCPELHKAIATHVLHGGIMPYQKNCNLQKHPSQNSWKPKLECFICGPVITESSTPYNNIHEKAEHIRRHLVQSPQTQYVTLNYKGTLAIQQCRECRSSTLAEEISDCLSETSEIRENLKFYADDSTASSSEIAVSISEFHQKRLTRKTYTTEEFVLVVMQDELTDPSLSVQQSLTFKEDFEEEGEGEEEELLSQLVTAETEDDIYQSPTSTSTKSSLKDLKGELTDTAVSDEKSLTSKDGFEEESSIQPFSTETEDDQRPISTSTKSSLKDSKSELTDTTFSDEKSLTLKDDFEEESSTRPFSTETEDDQRPISTSAKSSLKDLKSELTEDGFEDESSTRPFSTETEYDILQRPIGKSRKSSSMDLKTFSDEKYPTSKDDFEEESSTRPASTETEDQRPISTSIKSSLKDLKSELTEPAVSDEKFSTSKDGFEEESSTRPFSTETEDQRPISTSIKSSLTDLKSELTDTTFSDEKSLASKDGFEEESSTRPFSTETEDDQRQISSSSISSLKDSKKPIVKEEKPEIKKPPPKNVFQFVEYLAHLKEHGELERDKIDLEKLARWYDQGHISDIKAKNSIKAHKNKKRKSLSNDENKKIFFFARTKSETRKQFNSSCSNIVTCDSARTTTKENNVFGNWEIQANSENNFDNRLHKTDTVSGDRLLQVDSDSESEGCDQLKEVLDVFLDEDDVINLCAPLNAESSSKIECKFKMDVGLEKSYYCMLRNALSHATKQLLPAESVVMEKLALKYGNPKVMVSRHRNTVPINLIKESNSKPLIIPKCDLKIVKYDKFIPSKKYLNKNTLKNKSINCMLFHFPVKFRRCLVSHLNSNKYEKKMNLKVIKKKEQKLRTQNELSLKELGILSDHSKTMQAFQKVLSIKQAKDIMKPTFPQRKITDKYNLRSRKINDMNKIKRNLLSNALATHRNYKGFVNHMFAIGVLKENPVWRRNFVKRPGYNTNTTVRTASEKSLHTRKAAPYFLKKEEKKELVYDNYNH